MTSVYDVGVAMFWMLFLELENEAKAHLPLTCKSQNFDITATWLVCCSGGSGVTLTVIMEENHQRDIWCTEMSRWRFSFSQVQYCSDWMKGIQNNPLDVFSLLFCSWSIKWSHTASKGQLCVFMVLLDWQCFWDHFSPAFPGVFHGGSKSDVAFIINYGKIREITGCNDRDSFTDGHRHSLLYLSPDLLLSIRQQSQPKN